MERDAFTERVVEAETLTTINKHMDELCSSWQAMDQERVNGISRH